MKTQREVKQRAIWLATVSGFVLLSGCETYNDFRKNFFGTRPPQEVDLERRVPMMNAQYTGMQPQLQPQLQPPPPQMAMPQQPATPYDRFDESGNPVEMMPMQPQPTAAAPAQPPVQMTKGEPSEGNFFTRLFGGSSTQPDVDYGRRKPIPGNPPMRASRHMTPHMMSAMQEPAPEAMPEPQPMLVQPMEQVRMIDGRIVGDMSEPPPASVREDIASKPAMPELPARPPEPVMGFHALPVPVSPTLAPSTLTPRGDLPLVEAMPLDPDELKTPGETPVMMPKPHVALPQEQVVAVNGEGGMGGPFEEAEDAQDVPPVIPAVPATAPEEVADEEIFMPQTDVQMAAGETVTVSSLEDRQKEEASWFERTFGSFDSEEAAKPKKRTWIERQLGFEDEKPVEQQQPYPSFSDVPPNPERVEAMRESNQQQLREMESMRDQALESRMELDSEPSSQHMVAMPEPVEALAPAPAQPGQQQLLGHITAADEPAPLAPEGMTPLVRQQAPAPVEEVPAMAEPMALQEVPVAPPAPPAPPVPPVPVAATQPVPLQPMQAEPAQLADDDGGVIFPDAVRARQEEQQQAAEDVSTEPSATVEQMAAAKTASGLPSPKLLDEVQVLMPPSRYMNRRTQQSSQ